MVKTNKKYDDHALDERKALYILYTKLDEIKKNFFIRNIRERCDIYCDLRDTFTSGLLDQANKLLEYIGCSESEYFFNTEIDNGYPDSFTSSNMYLCNEGIIYITIAVDSGKPIESLASLVEGVASLSSGLKDMTMEQLLGTKIVNKTQSVFCDHGNPKTDCVTFKVRVSCHFNLKKEEIHPDSSENLNRADLYTVLTLLEYCLKQRDWNRTGLAMMIKLIDHLKLKV